MVIGRSQMTKQVEGRIRGAKKEKKNKEKKKPNRKNSKRFTV